MINSILNIIFFISLFRYLLIPVSDLKVHFQNEHIYLYERQRMVETQIRARGINDKKILDAFLKVERHKFVLPENQDQAYADYPLMIKEGQTISQPFIVAFMTDILNLKREEKVLEIGTGSGYQAAILSHLCDTVYTVEIFKTLANDAKILFSKMHYNNIKVKTGDGFLGWEEFAPYDAIIVTCSPIEVPDPLIKQLSEGGRIVIPVGKGSVQSLVLLEKKKGKIKQKKVLPVRFVPMINKEGVRY